MHQCFGCDKTQDAGYSAGVFIEDLADAETSGVD